MKTYIQRILNKFIVFNLKSAGQSEIQAILKTNILDMG